MEETQSTFSSMPWILPLVIFLAIWELIWKLIALWRAGRNNHLHWFIVIALVNTLGIIPIIYVLKNKNKSDS